MTILAKQIVLMESDVMADTNDGGGRMSGRRVADGQVNNTFPDISRLDRVYGRTQLRKLFLAILTANQDTLLGAHTILTKTPADPRVRVTLFRTDSHTDRRDNARDRIESYVVKGTEAPFYLHGRQLVGQRAIACLQRSEQKIPEPGDVYCLLNNNDTEQYVRVTDVAVSTGYFTISNGVNSYMDFSRRVLNLSIANPLEIEFDGSDPSPTGRGVGKARVLTTQVADAAKYYGTAVVTQDADPGDLQIQVDSVYNHLVPSAQSETPLVDRQAGLGARPVVPAATAAHTISVSNATVDADGFAVYYVGGAVAPGSLSFVSASAGSYSDQGGALKHVSGSNYVTASVVDYETGQIRVKWQSSSYNSQTVTLTYMPGAAVTQNARTFVTQVELANRGFNYIFQTPQSPAPKTVVVEYMALGNWCRMVDDGTGALTGDGSGTVDYATGTISATLAALPDVETPIIWTWGEGTSYAVQDGSITAPESLIEHRAANSIAPGTVTISWSVGSTTYQLTDDGSGKLTGDGSGTVGYAWGLIRFKQSTGGQSATLTYDHADSQPDVTTATPVLSGGAFSMTAPNAPIRPGSVSVTVPVLMPNVYSSYGAPDPAPQRTLDIYDTGHGELMWKGFLVGSVNYTTGAISISPQVPYTASQRIPYVRRTGLNGMYRWEKEPNPAPGDVVDYRWEPLPSTAEYVSGTEVTLSTRPSAATYATRTETISAPPITIDLVPDNQLQVVPGSILFAFRGKTYRDRSGAIVTDLDHRTNGGTAVGSIDYATGIVTLPTYPNGGNAVTLLAGLTKRGTLPVRRAQFRTAGAPLRLGSLIISGSRMDGTKIQLTAQINETITGSGVYQGRVKSDLGFVDIQFDVDIDPSTLTYSAVAYKYLPLEAELIGLDPVRLPADGRVPIFRSGDVGVISHTAQTVVAAPGAGQTVTLDRHHQAEVWIIGANGKRLAAEQYSLDREAGTVTFADPLALEDDAGEPVTTPLTIHDRIEDMALITDVQISGLIAINAALSQHYPAGETVFSSAVLHGDLRARVYNLFHQSTWTGGWSNERTGNDTTAKYNSVTYPIETTNQGSIQERWAIRFTSGSSFEVIGETVGVVGVGSISADCAITNPATGAPYFTIRSGGWGAGWVSGNTLRFNTEGAQAPFWVARTILSGPATEDNDQFITQNRGDAD